jgi:hypothetical protein
MKRTLGTADLAKLAQAYEHLARGEDLSAEDRRVLEWLALAVMKNEDPRPRFYVPLEGAAPAPHRHWVCMDFLLQADRDTRAKEARGRIADRWNLKDRTVREIVDEFQTDMRDLIDGSTNQDALSRVVEWHRMKYLAENSASNPKP